MLYIRHDEKKIEIYFLVEEIRAKSWAKNFNEKKKRI